LVVIASYHLAQEIVIGVNTYIWHGAEDNWSPVAMAEYLASTIPGCSSAEVFNGLSDYSCLYRAAPEICRQLGAASDDLRSPSSLQQH